MFEGFSALSVYLATAIAAAVEGEVAYVAAAALGDQIYFYLFRGRLTRWVARFPSLEHSAVPLVALARRRATLMVLLIRFAPGLRVALTAACVYVEVPPLKFSILNTITALVWAVVLLVLVAWFGPASLARLGLGGWKGALAMGLAVIVLFQLLSRFECRSMGIGRR